MFEVILISEFMNPEIRITSTIMPFSQADRLPEFYFEKSPLPCSRFAWNENFYYEVTKSGIKCVNEIFQKVATCLQDVLPIVLCWEMIIFSIIY